LHYKNEKPGDRSMHQLVLIPLVLICFASEASAQIYKCKDDKGKVAYSDAPCSSKSNQTVTDLQPTTVSTSLETAGSPAVNVGAAESPLARQLDAAVKGALATGDIMRAQELAVTAKHWDWIAAAKRDGQQRHVIGRTDADLSAEKGGTQACQQAKRAYEFEAGAYKQNENAIDAKRSMMREACGMKEPTEVRISKNRTTIIENRR
jgi:hypothetical protein